MELELELELELARQVWGCWTETFWVGWLVGHRRTYLQCA
jgi:hypothetical protein